MCFFLQDLKYRGELSPPSLAAWRCEEAAPPPPPASPLWVGEPCHARTGSVHEVSRKCRGAVSEAVGEPSHTRIGARCAVHPHAHVCGGTAGGGGLTSIGDDCRDTSSTLPRHFPGGLTSIGDDCLVMSHVHVGHDCSVGPRVAPLPRHFLDTS